MAQQEGRHRGIADRAAVRAAVAETERAVGMLEHFAQRFEIAVVITEDREHQQLPAVELEHLVVEHLERIATLALGDRLDRFLRRRLVVRRVAEREDFVQARRDQVRDDRDAAVAILRRLLGEDLPLDRGLAQLHDAFGERKACELLVRRAVRERVEGLVPDQQHRRARSDLRC